MRLRPSRDEPPGCRWRCRNVMAQILTKEGWRQRENADQEGWGRGLGDRKGGGGRGESTRVAASDRGQGNREGYIC